MGNCRQKAAGEPHTYEWVDAQPSAEGMPTLPPYQCRHESERVKCLVLAAWNCSKQIPPPPMGGLMRTEIFMSLNIPILQKIRFEKQRVTKTFDL